jgi:hypothetical protein
MNLLENLLNHLYYVAAGAILCIVVLLFIRKFWSWYLGLGPWNEKLEETMKEMSTIRELTRHSYNETKKLEIELENFMKSFEDIGTVRKIRNKKDEIF